MTEPVAFSNRILESIVSGLEHSPILCTLEPRKWRSESVSLVGRWIISFMLQNMVPGLVNSAIYFRDAYLRLSLVVYLGERKHSLVRLWHVRNCILR